MKRHCMILDIEFHAQQNSRVWECTPIKQSEYQYGNMLVHVTRYLTP